MALNLQAKGQQTTAVQSVSEGNDVYVRAMRDGSLMTQSWIMSQALQGRLYCAQAGLLTTAITWSATATNDQTKPAMLLDVPLGTTVIPLEISMYFEAFGTNALFEIAMLCGTGAVQAGGTAMTITNMRTDAPYTSVCKGWSDVTGGTAPTANISSFYASGTQLITTIASSDDASMRNTDLYKWSYTDSGYAPIVKGAAQLLVTQGSQAGTGFGKIIYLELPTSELL